MRIGKNPQKILRKVNHKFDCVKKYNITLLTVTYVPYVQGYYSDIIKIIKSSIYSAISDKISNFDLVIIDNNSCHEFRKQLLELSNSLNNLTIIMRNQNIGKIRPVLEYIKDCNSNFIYYFDSDIFHKKGYFDFMYKILNSEKIDLISLFYNPKPYSNQLKYLNNKHHFFTNKLNIPILKKTGYSITDNIEEFISKKINKKYLAKRSDSKKMMYAGYGHAQFLITQKFLKKINISDFLNKHNSRIMDKDFDKFLYSYKVRGYIIENDFIYHMGNSIEKDYFFTKHIKSPKRNNLLSRAIKKILFYIYFKLHKILH